MPLEMFQTTNLTRNAPQVSGGASNPASCSAFPGAFSPLVAMLIEQLGFDGVYIPAASSPPILVCPTSV